MATIRKYDSVQDGDLYAVEEYERWKDTPMGVWVVEFNGAKGFADSLGFEIDVTDPELKAELAERAKEDSVEAGYAPGEGYEAPYETLYLSADRYRLFHEEGEYGNNDGNGIPWGYDALKYLVDNLLLEIEYDETAASRGEFGVYQSPNGKLDLSKAGFGVLTEVWGFGAYAEGDGEPVNF